MTERPILFSGEMVKAILEGRKTQTRRVIKPQPDNVDHYEPGLVNEAWQSGHVDVRCPYGKPGEQLWVRETFMVWDGGAGGRQDFLYRDDPDWDGALRDRKVMLKNPDTDVGNYRVRPSIFMPRSASRITMEITDVRIERIQEIIQADAKAEGRECIAHLHSTWDKLNAKRGFGWDKNPWVWVIEFKRSDYQHGLGVKA